MPPLGPLSNLILYKWAESKFIIVPSSPTMDRERILEEIYQEAVSMGANGVVNLSVEISTKAINASLSVPVITVEGFAIKIP